MRRPWAILLVIGALGGLGAAGCSSATTPNGQVTTDGTEVVRFPFEGSPDLTDQQQTVQVLNTRFEAAGLNAQAQLVDGSVAVVGTSDHPASAAQIRALASPGSLHFQPVLTTEPVVPSSSPATTDAPDVSRSGQLVEVDADGQVVARYTVGPGTVDGTALEGAVANLDQRGKWEIRPVFKAGADGIDRFNAVAGLCFSKSTECPTGQLAVVLDTRVLTAPSINARSFERDQISISGNYDESQAKTVAAVLNSGALPATLRIDGN